MGATEAHSRWQRQPSTSHSEVATTSLVNIAQSLVNIAQSLVNIAQSLVNIAQMATPALDRAIRLTNETNQRETAALKTPDPIPQPRPRSRTS
jgi:hypothetical protein